MKRYCLSLLVCLLGAQSLPAAIGGDRPNILLIMADDVGREALGCYGGTSYETPQLDALAAGGIRFRHCYSMPVCHPSRMAIMTGRYPFRNPVGWGKWPANARTFAHMLRDAGYATAVAGKWQLTLMKYQPDHARELGFDESAVFGWHEGPRYHNPMIYRNGKIWKEFQKRDVYGPDVYTDFLIDFITRNKDRPFFAYYPMALCHEISDDFLPVPPPAPDGHYLTFKEMVEDMDERISRLVAALDRLGLREKTLILFTTDNGSPRNYLTGVETRDGKIVRHHKPVISKVGETAIRGGKGSMTDAGCRVPLIANRPGAVPAGRVVDDLIDFTDFLPTLADYAGMIPSNGVRLDGRSFAAQLEGRPGKPRDWIFCEHGGKRFVRTQRWKLYDATSHDDRRLFDMERDAAEQNPIDSTSQTNEAAAVREKLKRAFVALINPPPEALRRRPKRKQISYQLSPVAQKSLFVEAENFRNKGGWVVDQQFMDQMGSPYLMAHGLGIPVRDAVTQVTFPEKGIYNVFVRTYNWTAPWHAGEGPGRFKISINGNTLPDVLGIKGKHWIWQDTGKVNISKRKVEIALQDMTGFNGRCDAILFTQDTSLVPPSSGEELLAFRKKLLGIGPPSDGGNYDLVVVGGGAAGICAAVSAARLGVRVALINNRPVLGGNNSSEVRVALSGDITKNLYPNLGNVLKEFNPPKELFHPGWTSIMHAGPAENFLDDRKEAIVRAEKNINLFLNFHVFATEMQGNKIKSVIAKHIETGEEKRFKSFIFADCTGDGTVGYLAGADYRMGRESRYEAFESLAPLRPDKQLMGISNLWSYETCDTPSTFPVLDWAVQVSDQYHVGDDPKPSRWESGFNKNTIIDAESIRDQNLRAVFGNWSYLKNNNPKYANRKLDWVAYIGGKRESRRLLGDIILNQNDIQNRIDYEDASFTTTWPIDEHFPDPENSKYYPGQEWRSSNIKIKILPYHVPYRCLYSRNIDNLFMAGRDISVTHVALGTVRVQRTTAMMGEVVGMAASICNKYQVSPRSVYLEYLTELKNLMKAGIPTQ